MTNLILALVLIAILLLILQKNPRTKLTDRPINLLVNGFIYARLDLATRFLAHSICVTAPLVLISLLTTAEMFSYAVAFMAFAILIPPELAIDENSELVITKKPLRHGVDIHLRNPYQSFTMRTYKELLFLVEYLPGIGVKIISLSSPMFYTSNGKLRNFSTLEKLLIQKNATLSSYEAKPWQNILGKMSMIIDSAKDKKEKVKKINLNKWHVIMINIRG